MNKQELIEVFKKQMEVAFEEFYRRDILGGREPLITDISMRTYPYTDLIKAYSHGVGVACDIMIEQGKDKE